VAAGAREGAGTGLAAGTAVFRGLDVTIVFLRWLVWFLFGSGDWRSMKGREVPDCAEVGKECLSFCRHFVVFLLLREYYVMV
jgi:hypothetical protein